MPKFRVANYYSSSDTHVVEAENEEAAYHAGKEIEDSDLHLNYEDTIVLEQLDDDNDEEPENRTPDVCVTCQAEAIYTDGQYKWCSADVPVVVPGLLKDGIKRIT